MYDVSTGFQFQSPPHHQPNISRKKHASLLAMQLYCLSNFQSQVIFIYVLTHSPFFFCMIFFCNVYGSPRYKLIWVSKYLDTLGFKIIYFGHHRGFWGSSYGESFSQGRRKLPKAGWASGNVGGGAQSGPSGWHRVLQRPSKTLVGHCSRTLPTHLFRPCFYLTSLTVQCTYLLSRGVDRILNQGRSGISVTSIICPQIFQIPPPPPL